MSMYWYIDNGTIETTGHTEQVRELLEGRVDIDSVEGSKICFSFSGDVSDEFPDELAEELGKMAAFIANGSFEAVAEDNTPENHYRYVWEKEKGRFKFIEGQVFFYFPGLEDEFVGKLPKAVIDKIAALQNREKRV